MTEIEFLLKIKEYIEGMKKTIDCEWGRIREISEIILDNDMPDIYEEVINRIKNER